MNGEVVLIFVSLRLPSEQKFAIDGMHSGSYLREKALDVCGDVSRGTNNFHITKRA